MRVMKAGGGGTEWQQLKCPVAQSDTRFAIAIARGRTRLGRAEAVFKNIQNPMEYPAWEK